MTCPLSPPHPHLHALQGHLLHGHYGHGVPSHRHIAHKPQFELRNTHKWMCIPTCSLALLYLSAQLDLSTYPTPSPLACTVRPALHGHGTLSHRHIARELRFELRITCTNGRTYHTCNQPCSILYLRAPLDWPTHPTLSPSACIPRPPIPW